MKEYDAIALGTGSVMNIVDLMLRQDRDLKFAVIDKDEPGGICLTRGCIPSKILLYPAEVIRTIERADKFGIEVDVGRVDFARVMERMRDLIGEDMEGIRRGLSQSENIDYYHDAAEFVAPYTMRVAGEEIRSDLIFLGAGSRPLIPRIEGLEEAGFQTSHSLLQMSEKPESLAVIGGGYIAAEYGHFFSAMGTDVTVVGRNPQFLPEEEPEVSEVAEEKLGRHMEIITNHEVRQAEKTSEGKKLVAFDVDTDSELEVVAEEVLVAAGRRSNADVLKPEKGGIETDAGGWIETDEYLESSQDGVWALGDGLGRYQFKHTANYESMLVYKNAVQGRKEEVDYHAVPHAVFTYPEVAAVGMKEEEAIEEHGEDGVLIGFYKYEDTAKGEAMAVEDYFVKGVVKRDGLEILGAHVVGPYASILIQEVINLMYTRDRSVHPMFDGMHIHPALSEVVERAFTSLMSPSQYRHQLEHQH